MTAITVEEMIEALRRCDPHKPVEVGWMVEDRLNRNKQRYIPTRIKEVLASAPTSIANPVQIFISNPEA